MIVTQDGLGPIGKDTLIDRFTLKKLLPNLLIKENKDCEQDCTELHKVFTVMKKNIHLFTITPHEKSNKIERIDIHDPGIITVDGFHVGSKFDDFSQKYPLAKCNAVIETGDIFCEFKGLGHLTFFFSGEAELKESNDWIATKKYYRKMQKRQVALIAWSP